MTSQCTEKNLRDMIAEDTHKLKTVPMDSRSIIALALEIKHMDLFRQQLENKRVIDELADVP